MSSSRGRAVETLCQPQVAPVVDLVASQDPMAIQDPMAFRPHPVELADPCPPNTRNAYSYGPAWLLSFFADRPAPDVVIVHTPEHHFPDLGGQIGEHGSLDVIQSRVPLLQSMIDTGELPVLTRLLEGGLALRGGAVAEFPSVTLTNHTSALIGMGSGRQGVVGNVCFDRATGERVVPNDASTWHRWVDWVRPGVDTVFEVVAAAAPRLTWWSHTVTDTGHHTGGPRSAIPGTACAMRVSWPGRGAGVPLPIGGVVTDSQSEPTIACAWCGSSASKAATSCKKRFQAGNHPSGSRSP